MNVSYKLIFPSRVLTLILAWAGILNQTYMAIDDQLSASDYLPTLYVQVSTALDDFRSTGDIGSLHKAAFLLCDGMSKLSEDGRFWAAVNDLPKLEEGNRAEVTKLLSDIDELSRQEEVVLREALGVSSAMRLIGDVATAMDLLRSHQSGLAVENVRNRVRDLRDEVCDSVGRLAPAPVAAEPPAWRRGILKGYRVVSKGLFVVGGGTLVVLNWKAAPLTLGASIASSYTGYKMIKDQFQAG